MTRKLIHTPDYLIAVDDSEIKKGDYRLNTQKGYVKIVKNKPGYYNRRNDVFKKVIGHLPLNNSPALEGVALLPSYLLEEKGT